MNDFTEKLEFDDEEPLETIPHSQAIATLTTPTFHPTKADPIQQSNFINLLNYLLTNLKYFKNNRQQRNFASFPSQQRNEMWRTTKPLRPFSLLKYHNRPQH